MYVVRHGEKMYGGGCLNIQGEERANNFPRLFKRTNKKRANTTTNNNSNSTTTTNTNTTTTNNFFFETPTVIFANNYFKIHGGIVNDVY